MPTPRPILTPTLIRDLNIARSKAHHFGSDIMVSAHTRRLPRPLPQIIRLLARFSDLETAVHRLCSQADRNRAAGHPLNASDRAAARAAITLLTDTFHL